MQKAVIEDAISKHPNSVEPGDLNLLLELHLVMATYEEALEVICQHCGAQFIADRDLNNADFAELMSPAQQVWSLSSLKVSCRLLTNDLYQLAHKHQISNLGSL